MTNNLAGLGKKRSTCRQSPRLSTNSFRILRGTDCFIRFRVSLIVNISETVLVGTLIHYCQHYWQTYRLPEESGRNSVSRIDKWYEICSQYQVESLKFLAAGDISFAYDTTVFLTAQPRRELGSWLPVSVATKSYRSFLHFQCIIIPLVAFATSGSSECTCSSSYLHFSCRGSMVSRWTVS